MLLQVAVFPFLGAPLAVSNMSASPITSGHLPLPCRLHYLVQRDDKESPVDIFRCCVSNFMKVANTLTMRLEARIRRAVRQGRKTNERDYLLLPVGGLAPFLVLRSNRQCRLSTPAP